MSNYRVLTTREKALNINMNPAWYGSFAEIGAGQEIAAHFFKAGGASGTIAKTMSAYDMTFSDAIYGKTQRYVCKERLIKMLDHEYRLLEERLQDRAADTCFFAFANTIEALNYKKTNQGHGWIGIRFQLTPQSEPNDVIMHVVLRDRKNIWQQEAIGMVGVNLLYGCLNYHNQPYTLLQSLMDNLSTDRLEVDMFKLCGPDFRHIDNRLLSLKLVRMGMTQAAMFGPDGEVMLAANAFYKKNILVFRGRFRPPTLVNIDMLKAGVRKFFQEEEVEKEHVQVIAELTLKNLTADGKIDEQDFLDRVDLLGSQGMTVMVSNYHRYYRLVYWLAPFARGKKMGIVLGINNLEMVFDERYYEDLHGKIIEAFGILFGTNIKLYVYPAQREGKEELYTCDNFELPRKELYQLFNYLKDTNKIEDIKCENPDLLNITSDKVLDMIKKGEAGWEEMVPVDIETAIKESGLFGYKKQSETLTV